MRKLIIAAGAAAGLFASSAAHAVPWWWPLKQEAPSEAPQAMGPAGERGRLGEVIYLAAQTMVERAGALAKDRPIVVSTVVSIDDLNRSSTFGRLSSQLVANRLAQRGYLVRDLTYMGALTIQPNTGELVLSRDASRLLDRANAQAVVAGTYAVGGREIYLNLRLLRADDGRLLSTADVVVPLDHNTEDLVGVPMRWTANDARVPDHVIPFTDRLAAERQPRN